MKVVFSTKTALRLGGGLALLAFVLINLGLVPTIAGLARRLGASLERFPCEDHACGCASARECWTACCCFDDVGRLAWTFAHGVEPPHGLVFDEADWLAAARRFEPDACGLCVARLKEGLARGVALGTNALRPERSCCAAGPDSTRAPAIVRASCKGDSTVVLLAFCLTRLADTPGIDVIDGPGRPVWWPAEVVPSGRSLGVPTPPPRL